MRNRKNSPAPADPDAGIEARIVQRPDGYHWLTVDGIST